ncbi:RNA-dependent RNA polymerase [Icoaraci virus]|uniref:RNA-directed RNA polymerase L n=3 Tax=Icoaraci virus TaxID=426790 RepID=A0A4P8D7S0_9VIRU|nr:RNA-dependent RNA polymerase [Icoaraci virus]QCI62745.1 RNA-dependent RNA polymerase [Icoaraci virus]
MDSIISKQQPLDDGFNRRPLIDYDELLLEVPLPEFSVEKFGDGLVVNLDLNNLDETSTVGSTLKPDLKIKASKVPNFVHDFTFGHLCSNTDRTFMSYFPMVNDGFNHLSPDVIMTTPAGSTYVIEFTTFRGDSNGARNAALLKIGKYEVACQNRTLGGRLMLAVISVHRHGVWTNLELEEEDVNELVFRFRLALSIFAEIQIHCPTTSADEDELTKLEREVLGMVGNISMDWDKTARTFPSFNKGLFDNFAREPDSEYVSKVISESLKKSQDKMFKSSFFDIDDKDERVEKNCLEAEQKIKDYVDKYNADNPDQRPICDHKSTVQIPPWVTLEGPEGKGLSPLKGTIVSGDHPMCGIWQAVVRAADSGEIERMDDDPALELELAMDGAKERPDERNKYHRVKIVTTPFETEYIAMHGVNGKEHRDKMLVKMNREKSKKAFSLSHDTADLERFIRDDSTRIFRSAPDLYCPLSEDEELRKEAMSIHQPSLHYKEGGNEFTEVHNNLLRTPLGSWTQMVSVIGAELSASVKQHVKQDFFVVKRLLGSEIYLLIKPTCSRSHIFVSFAVKKSHVDSFITVDGVFKHFVDAGDMFITDFVSYRQSKLTNLCKSFSLFESSLAFWTECHGGKPWLMIDPEIMQEIPDARIMTKLSLLTMLEDKACTEELQTIMRYVVMEGFVSEPEIPKPQKMLVKMPKILRSELQVLLANNFFNTVRRIAKSPFLLRKKEGNIQWSGLFNPITGHPTKELQVVVSACYNGYFKNKEEETEPQALSGMYKKIIELEDQRPKTDDYLGWEDPEEPKMHEFSRSYLKEVCRHGIQLLKRVYGQNVLEQIDDQITREVSSLTLERLATLKATSQFTEDWYVYKDVKDKNYTRDRLLVKMSKFAMEDKTLAIEKFEECMSSIEAKGSMHICLFKKQQHGGLREIYVMGAEERIVQSIVETIAKSIGKFFPSDTLCNPSNKTKIPETHGYRARQHCKSQVWTCATSDDARKWNQGHYVTKFALMLCEFTHPRWWPIIIRGCSMFTSKKMMMNLKFMKILDTHLELDTRDEFSQKLFKAYHGEESVPWAEAGKTFLKTTTGMMQGILHYTSSLLHTLHQEYIRSLTFKIFNLKVGEEYGSKIVCDMMQGSDDSSMLLSFPSENPEALRKLKVAAALCFRLKKELGIYIGIYPSEKCTSNTDFVMEYNSEFFFHSQHVRPTIRWVAACCSLPEVETLVARQEEASNLLTAVSEGGGSFSLSAILQQAQCSLHYMLMGMGVSTLFKNFARAAIKWKDPGLGFFLLDNPYSAGLGGFRFNLFKAITRTNLMRVYAYFMKKVKGDSTTDEVPESCSVSPGGALILSSSLRWGSKKKFFNLRARLNIPEDWKERINLKPEVLYRAPKSGEEIILRIAEKVHSPGVVSSLSSGNAVSKVMASSVYFLSATIFHDTGRPEFSILEDSKYSLLQKMAAYEGFDGHNDLEPDDVLFLFPNVEELESLDAIVFDKGRIQLRNRSSRREATQSRVTVFDEVKTMRTSPEKLVSDKWFSTQKSKIGDTAFNIEWAKLKGIIKWLRDTPEDTLEASPLDSHIQIKNFFARMEGKSRTVRITGAPIKKRSGVSKIAMVIRDNFCKSGFLAGVEDIAGATRGLMSESLKHVLFCILQGPYTDEAKLLKCYQVLQNTTPIELKPSDGGSKSNKVAILQRYSSDERNVIESLEEVGAGVLGGYVKAQKSKSINGNIHYHGVGIWRGLMDGVQVQIEIDNRVGAVPQIQAVSIYGSQSPWEVSQSIRMWADDMGVRNDQDLASKHKHAKFWMHNYKVFGPSRSFGAPVFILSKPMYDLRTLKEDQIKMKIRRSTINLYTTTPSGRDLHILSYTASDSDLSPISLINCNAKEIEEIMTTFSKEPSRSWIKCKPLELKYMESVLEVCEGKRRIHTIDGERLAAIVKTCCESSLRTKVGTIFIGAPKHTEMPQLDMESIIDLMIEDSENNVFEEVVKSLSDDIGSFPLDDEFDVSDINLFGPAHYREIGALAMVSHPLMDRFVDHLINNVGRSPLRRVLESGVCQSRHRALSSLLYRALGRPIENLRVEDLEDEENNEPVEDDMLG